MDNRRAFIDYLERERNFSAHTIKAYERDLSQFQNYLNDSHDGVICAEVNYSLIRSWIVHLVDSGLANKTINRKVSSLKTYYKFLIKIKAIETSPLQTHVSLKEKHKRQLAFSEKEIEEVNDLLRQECFNNYRERAIITLMYATGIRRAELIDLEEHQINWKARQIKVFGKRSKERILPVGDETIEALKQWKAERADMLGEKPAVKFFITDKGASLYPKWLYRLVKSYFSRVSSKTKCSPHIIRHSFATHLLNHGADLNSVKELLGHKSLNSTQIYARFNLNKLKKVYDTAHPRNN